MKLIEEIRRINAQSLVVHGQAAFARALNSSAQQVNAFLGPYPSRNIGHKTARAIEVAFDKPVGWLDTDHTIDHTVLARKVSGQFTVVAGKLNVDRVREYMFTSEPMSLSEAMTLQYVNRGYDFCDIQFVADDGKLYIIDYTLATSKD